MNAWKILQRQVYDILSNKYYLVLVILLVNTSLISILHFCEFAECPCVSVLEYCGLFWNKVVPYINGSSNFGCIKGARWCHVRKDSPYLCQYSPIDAVYTWVNGSDPVFIEQLKQHRKLMRKQLSESCPYVNCVPSHITAAKLGLTVSIYLGGREYKSLESVSTSSGDHWTLIGWDSVETASNEADRIVEIDQINVTVSHAHWTTDGSAPNTYTPNNSIAVMAFANRNVTNFTKTKLESWLGLPVTAVWIYSHIACVQFQSYHYVDYILKGDQWRLISVDNGIKLNVSRTFLILELPSTLQPLDHAPSRFEDKEELRYSLRSLDKYAPWVRHVYIVTNGQIPHWLDLSNPRVRIVTHTSIFKNLSHLPTFSSPAIETHIHRIPGLSDKFLYINDDIFFGGEVWPDDFFTSNGGQRVYLSWPVPDCSSLCPWSWVGDGTCDVPCNITICDFDGGDCTEHKSNNQHIHIHEDEDDDEYTTDRETKYINLKHDEVWKLFEDYNDNGNTSIFKHQNIANSDSKNKLNFTNSVGIESKQNFTFSSDSQVEELFNTVNEIQKKFTSNVIQNLFSKFSRVVLTNKVNSHNNGSSRNIKESLLLSKLTKTYMNLLKNSNLTQLNMGKIKDITSNFDNILAHVIINSSDSYNIKNIYSEKLYESNKTYFLSDMRTTEVVPSQTDVNHTGVAFPIGNLFTLKSETVRRLDTFAESLLHVNALLNKRYGYKARKVAAHMPHFIDKYIMDKLQAILPIEYEETSSHKLRSPHDIQFALAYFYFLMSENVDIPVSQIFDKFDTDSSGTWSDREIRTVLTHLYDLPLQRSSILSFENSILHCARTIRNLPAGSTTPLYERYIDSKLPLVTRHLIQECHLISDLLKRKMGKQHRYNFTVIKTSDREALVGFHMITSNLSHLLITLDKIRRKPKKFICLNDNMDPTQIEDNELIRSVLLDFYHSLFPIPSQFELPGEYRNRYLYYDDFIAWQLHRTAITTSICSAVIFFCILTLMYVFKLECQRLARKLWYTMFRHLQLLPNKYRRHRAVSSL